MRAFYKFYSSAPILHQAGGELLNIPTEFLAVPWRHHIEILTKCSTYDEAIFYIQQTIENGWSRNMLIHFMESDLYKAKGKALNNFSKILPAPQSDLASEMLKDPLKKLK